MLQISKCSACGHPLEHPSVHFLCQHSYHQTCFQSYSDSEAECPACHSENKKVLEILRSQEKRRGREDEFRHQMETSEDKFKVVAEYMGLGVFGSAEEEARRGEQRRRAGPAPVAAQQHQQAASLVGPGAEARLRASQVSNVMQPEASEARLRAAERGPSPRNLVSEERLRATQASEANIGVPMSVGRMRQSQQRPEDNFKTSNPNRSVNRAPAPAAAASQNPFGDPEEDEDLGADNPFAEETSKKAAASSNPFGEPEDESPDYDDAKNPFA